MCNAMRNKPLTIVLLLIFCSFNSVHKDRIEKPISVDLILENGHKLTWKELTKTKLCKLNLEIDSKSIILSKAVFKFKTGEVLTLIGNGHSWKEIQISFKNQKLEVPEKVVKKINEIDFSTLSLLWSDDSNKAFESNNFYIKMQIGKKKYFGKLPELELSFENDKFSEAIIWKGVDENSIQWSKF